MLKKNERPVFRQFLQAEGKLSKMKNIIAGRNEDFQKW